MSVSIAANSWELFDALTAARISRVSWYFSRFAEKMHGNYSLSNKRNDVFIGYRSQVAVNASTVGPLSFTVVRSVALRKLDVRSFRSRRLEVRRRVRQSIFRLIE